MCSILFFTLEVLLLREMLLLHSTYCRATANSKFHLRKAFFACVAWILLNQSPTLLTLFQKNEAFTKCLFFNNCSNYHVFSSLFWGPFINYISTILQFWAGYIHFHALRSKHNFKIGAWLPKTKFRILLWLFVT